MLCCGAALGDARPGAEPQPCHVLRVRPQIRNVALVSGLSSRPQSSTLPSHMYPVPSKCWCSVHARSSPRRSWDGSQRRGVLEFRQSPHRCCGKGWEAGLGCTGLRAQPAGRTCLSWRVGWSMEPPGASGRSRAWGMAQALGSHGWLESSGRKRIGSGLPPLPGHLCKMFLLCSSVLWVIRCPKVPTRDCFFPLGVVSQAAIYPQ